MELIGSTKGKKRKNTGGRITKARASLQITTETGCNFSVRVAPDTTVLELKERIEEQAGIDMHLQEIKRGDKILKDEKYLQQYRMREDELLFVRVRNVLDCEQEAVQNLHKKNKKAAKGASSLTAANVSNSSSPSQKSHHILQLLDQRKLEYCVYRNPKLASASSTDGEKMVIFLGEFFMTAKHSMNLALLSQIPASFSALVVISRPGFGESSPNAQASIVSLAKDVELVVQEIAKQSKQPLEWYMIAFGFGCPFALAILQHMKPHFFKQTVLMASPCCPVQFHEAYKSMNVVIRLNMWLAKRSVKLASLKARRFAAKFLKQPDTGLLKFVRHPFDMEYLNKHSQTKRMLVSAIKQVYRAEQWDQQVQEYLLLGNPWNFEMPTKGSPIHLFYGECDALFPPLVGKSLHKAIKPSTLTIVPNVGHFGLLFEAWEHGLQQLLRPIENYQFPSKL